MPKIVKIVAYNEQYRITLPKVLVQLKNWKAGTRLAIAQLPDGTITLKEVEDKPEVNKNEKQKKR